MSDLDIRVSELLSSPLGCAFLLTVQASGLTPETAVEPIASFSIAAHSVNIIERWRADHETVVKGVLERGRNLGQLARAILEQPGAAWWFSSLDTSRQVWVNWSLTSYDDAPPNPDSWPVPASPPTRWERYAQKPLGKTATSTFLAGGTASLLTALDQRAGDYWCVYPVACWLLQALPAVRVFEIHSPNDWHDLCVRYPATWHSALGGDGRLVPDWGAAAADWDAAHLSFGGLLACEQARVESEAGWSQHEFWHAEQTFWLRWAFTGSHQLADHDQQPAPEWLRFPRI